MLPRMDGRFALASRTQSFPGHQTLMGTSGTRSERRQRAIQKCAQVSVALALLLFSVGILVLRRIYPWDGKSLVSSRYNISASIDNDASGLEDHVEVQLNVDPVLEEGALRLSDNLLFSNSDFVDLPFFDSASTTAILLVSSTNVDGILDILEPLIAEHSSVSALALICPPDLLTHLTSVLKGGHPNTYLDISVSTWLDGSSEGSTMIAAASQAHTEYLLFLGHEGLGGLDEDARNRLVAHPLLIDTGCGFCGGSSTEESGAANCVTSQPEPQNASFLLPPFVMPSSLVHGWNISVEDESDIWKSLGEHITHDFIGGIVQGSTSHSTITWCKRKCKKHNLATEKFVVDCPSSASDSETNNDPPRADPASSNVLALVLPTLDDFVNFSVTACMFLESGLDLRVLIRSHNFDHNLTRDTTFPWLHDQLHSGVCNVLYSALHSATNENANAEAVSFWLASLEMPASVIVYGLSDSDDVTDAELREARQLGSLVISIPQADLGLCDWMASLSLKELRGWYLPDIEIVVVTDDRPHSLTRLLRSLNTARYYGDSPKLRINMEQSADAETQQVVNDFEWPFGSVFVHHRVIHAGLLTSIVESWYPHTNDTYGVILEDDVEISPLFYAWIKMSLLRYRYGDPENRAPSMFGISLYQQKVNELRPEGRKPFDAHSLFHLYGLPKINTPYLSQVPCSWGAVYFPEHWREFHSYLALRFSDDWLSVDEHVVPHVRSNKWRKSWKKFFIEMIYLRGYVMLYPNYDGFLSLSTNHLEVGSHVKEEPKDIYDQKRMLFTLPLMDAPKINSDGPEMLNTGLLDLPGRHLPLQSELPVLDLLGEMSSKELLEERGATRQVQMLGCKTYGSDKRRKWVFNAEDLFTCVEDVTIFSESDNIDVKYDI